MLASMKLGLPILLSLTIYKRYGSLDSTGTDGGGIIGNNSGIYNPNVNFGINNQPHDMPTAMILRNGQAAIDGIRAAGPSQLTLVPGNGYTGAQVWTNAFVSNNGTFPEYAPSPMVHLMPNVFMAWITV
ncbi:hypothetical protein KC349_g3157 [Hortaea werneckii]|nr:hypothetical protein KC349_g3157 [Hortaea werneckii]